MPSVIFNSFTTLKIIFISSCIHLFIQTFDKINPKYLLAHFQRHHLFKHFILNTYSRIPTIYHLSQVYFLFPHNQDITQKYIPHINHTYQQSSQSPMDQFLNQLLNNPPTKKRTQTLTNNQIVKRNSEKQSIQQFIQLERNDSQPGLNSSGQFQINYQNQLYQSEISQGGICKSPQDQSQSYEVEEVTEQIMFDDDGVQTTAQKLRGFLPQVNESLPQFEASRQQQTQQVLQEYFSYKGKQSQTLKNPGNMLKTQYYYNHASNRPISKNVAESKHIQQTSISISGLQGLINGINNVKTCQTELSKWFQLERQGFSEYLQTVISKIQLQIKKSVSKTSHINKNQAVDVISLKEQLREQIRQQLKSSIRRQLEAQFSQQYQLSSQKSQIRNSLKQQWQSKQNQLPSQSQQSMSNSRKWQIEKKLIKQQLQQRYQYRLQKLQQQLQQQRKYSEQLIRTYQESHKPSTIKSSGLGKNSKGVLSEVDEEVLYVRKQLEDRDRTINELETEIERLNEHIFDIEQQVEGIELEVENKVREKIKTLQAEHQRAIQQIKATYQINSSYNEYSPAHELNPILETSSHLEQSTRLLGLPSTHHPSHLLQQLTESQLQNQQLKKIISDLQQQKSSIQLQLKEQQNLILFREQQIKQNQQDIAFEWAQIEKQRSIRQQKLAIAQQNISNQISQIRTKQLDLDRWETELQKRQLALDIRQNQINQKLQEIVRQSNYQKQLQNSVTHKDQINRNSPQTISNTQSQNRLSRQNLNDFRTQGGGSFRPNGIQIPELPIGKKYHQHDIIKHEKSFDHDYNYRSKPHEILSKANFEKSFEDGDRGYTRQNRSRERNVITSTNFRSNRANPNSHQFVLPQSSKVQRHSRSKSRSKEKGMLRNTFGNGSSSISTNTYKNPSVKSTYMMDNYYMNKQSANLDGLGSKLQRLRDEIKRQIDSIK